MKRRKVNRTGHILRMDRLLVYVIEGKIEGRMEVTEWRGRLRKQLLYDLKAKRGYWILKEEALGRTVWRTGFGRGSGPVAGQNAGWMDEWVNEINDWGVSLPRRVTAVWWVITNVSKRTEYPNIEDGNGDEWNACLSNPGNYSHASLNDGDTFKETRRWVISSFCERHRVYIHKSDSTV